MRMWIALPLLACRAVQAASAPDAAPVVRGGEACAALQAAADESADRFRSMIVVGAFELGGRRVQAGFDADARVPYPHVVLADDQTGAWPQSVPDLEPEMQRHPRADAAVMAVAGQHHVVVFANWQPQWTVWLEHPGLGCDFRHRRAEYIVHARPPRELCTKLLRGQPVPTQAMRRVVSDGALVEPSRVADSGGATVEGWFHADFANAHQPVDVAVLSATDGHCGVTRDYLELLAPDHKSPAAGSREQLLAELDPGPLEGARHAFLTWGGKTFLDVRTSNDETGRAMHVVRSIDAGHVESVCEFGFHVTATPALVERRWPRPAARP